jgi:hypothetical protein
MPKIKINYEVKLVDKTVNFFKRHIRKTYKIVKVISISGIVKKVTVGILTVIFVIASKFGNFDLPDRAPTLQSQTSIETVVESPGYRSATFRTLEDIVENPRSRLVTSKSQGRTLEKSSKIPGSRSATFRTLEDRVEIFGSRSATSKSRGRTLEKLSESPVLELSGGDLTPTSPTGEIPGIDSTKVGPKRKKTKSKKSNSGSTGFAQSFTQNTPYDSRPAGAKRAAQKFTTLPSENGNGLFGRFTARPKPSFNNPGCSAGPRSVTVMHQAKSGQQESGRTMTTHDGFKALLKDRQADHLTSNHGHNYGIDDQLPANPNQKVTKHPQVRTRINNKNRAVAGDFMEDTLQNPATETYPSMTMRGTKGRGYYNQETNTFVGIHTEGDLAGQIIKAQPLSEQQVQILREQNRVD